MAQLDKTFPTNDCSTCMISPKLIEVASDPNITIHTRTEISGIQGEPGDFKVSLHKEPRFVDLDVCNRLRGLHRGMPHRTPGRL